MSYLLAGSDTPADLLQELHQGSALRHGQGLHDYCIGLQNCLVECPGEILTLLRGPQKIAPGVRGIGVAFHIAALLQGGDDFRYAGVGEIQIFDTELRDRLTMECVELCFFHIILI